MAGGGTGYGHFLDTAEVYDPTSMTWAATQTMVQPRYLHTATLLQYGRVLVVGGFASPGGVAELYDPVSKIWTPVPGPEILRDGHAAALASNGEVVVLGGRTSSNAASNSVEVFNPVTGQWRTEIPMKRGQFYHTATALPNGGLLVIGGFGWTGCGRSCNELRSL